MRLLLFKLVAFSRASFTKGLCEEWMVLKHYQHLYRFTDILTIANVFDLVNSKVARLMIMLHVTNRLNGTLVGQALCRRLRHVLMRMSFCIQFNIKVFHSYNNNIS